MTTCKTPVQDTTKRYARYVSSTRGGCYSSPKINTQGVALYTPLTVTRTSVITGFRTVLNHRVSTQ